MSTCPEPIQLWAVVDGEADATTSEHVAGCARCAEWIEGARALDTDLRGALADPVSDLEQASHRRRLARAIAPRRWRWLAAAAALLAIWAALPGSEQEAPQPVAEAPAKVERYSPMRSVEDVQLVASTDDVRRGQRLRFEGAHYGRVTVARARWLVHPDSEVAVDRSKLVLHRGSVTLEKPGDAPASLTVGAYELSGRAFSASLEQGGVQLEVLSGQLEVSGSVTETFGTGTHRLGGAGSAVSTISVQRAYARAFEYWRAERWDEAGELFGVAANSPKGNVAEIATFYRAACFGRAKRWVAAIEALEHFIHRFPASREVTHARYYIGVYCEALGNKTDADAAYVALLREPDSALHPLARMRRARLKPTFEAPEPLWQRFRAAWAANRNAEALGLIEELIEKAPTNPNVVMGNARFYRWCCSSRLRKFDRALEQIDEFLAQHPRHRSVPYTRYFRAVTLMRLARKAAARAELDRFERDYPDHSLLPHARGLRRQLNR